MNLGTKITEYKLEDFAKGLTRKQIQDSYPEYKAFHYLIGENAVEVFGVDLVNLDSWFAGNDLEKNVLEELRRKELSFEQNFQNSN